MYFITFEITKTRSSRRYRTADPVVLGLRGSVPCLSGAKVSPRRRPERLRISVQKILRVAQRSAMFIIKVYSAWLTEHNDSSDDKSSFPCFLVGRLWFFSFLLSTIDYVDNRFFPPSVTVTNRKILNSTYQRTRWVAYYTTYARTVDSSSRRVKSNRENAPTRVSRFRLRTESEVRV